MILFSINFLSTLFLSAYMGSTVCPNFEDFSKQYLKGSLYDKRKFLIFLTFFFNALYVMWAVFPFLSIQFVSEMIEDTDAD